VDVGSDATLNQGFWGQIFNLENGGEIEEKAKKDRALGKKNSKDSKSQFLRIKI
jgi:hypothetical protein